MKRTGFLTMVLSLLALPFRLKAGKDQAGTVRLTKGFKVKAGEGRIHGHMTLKGINANILDIKISGRDTDGDLAIFEQTSLSQGRGTPLHVHPHQDEVFYVVEGSYYFQVGEERFHLDLGESIFLPRNVPHAWTQVSAKGKMTVTFQPAGKMEEFFVAMQNLDHIPSQADLVKLFIANDMRILGPPLKID